MKLQTTLSTLSRFSANLALALCLPLTCVLPLAHAAKDKQIDQAQDKAPKEKKQAAVAAQKAESKPKVQRAPKGNTGGITSAEERRMVRECKNKPNAGACLGYKN